MTALADIRGDTADVPLVDKTTRTVERWVDHAADRCRAETGDDGWRDVSAHDFRRTWATLLAGAEMHVGCVRSVELPAATRDRADILAVNSASKPAPRHYLVEGDHIPDELNNGYPSIPEAAVELSDIIAGVHPIDQNSS